MDVAIRTMLHKACAMWNPQYHGPNRGTEARFGEVMNELWSMVTGCVLPDQQRMDYDKRAKVMEEGLTFDKSGTLVDPPPKPEPRPPVPPVVAQAPPPDDPDNTQQGVGTTKPARPGQKTPAGPVHVEEALGKAPDVAKSEVRVGTPEKPILTQEKPISQTLSNVGGIKSGEKFGKVGGPPPKATGFDKPPGT